MQISANWLFCAGGYYRYDEGFTPEFEGRERFRGQIVHPQHWPEDLDYTRQEGRGHRQRRDRGHPGAGDGRRPPAHVTMLQRSPTYVCRCRRRTPSPTRLRKVLGDERGYALARRKNIAAAACRLPVLPEVPERGAAADPLAQRQQLPEGYPVDEHFNPAYNPWDQRLCAVPDGDLFGAISSGSASVVTDRIATFTETGILLESGRELDADIIVTATGLNVQLFGGIAAHRRRRAGRLRRTTVAYKGIDAAAACRTSPSPSATRTRRGR